MEVLVPLHPDQGAVTASQPRGELGAERVDGLLGLGVSAALAGKGAHPSCSGFQPNAPRWSTGITRRRPSGRDGKFMCV